MKRSLFILATLAMSSALYAQGASGGYTREQVLDIFAQYNPAVLEYADQNADYNAILESFVSSYQEPLTPENRYELIAVARNFNNSIRLRAATLAYEDAWLYTQMSGNEIPMAATRFRREMLSVFARIWAVSIQIYQYQAAQAQAALEQLVQEKNLFQEEHSRREASLRKQLAGADAQLKALQRDPGQQVVAAAEAYIAQTEELLARRQEAALARAEAVSQEAQQAENLQIKTKNKKPVAK